MIFSISLRKERLLWAYPQPSKARHSGRGAAEEEELAAAAAAARAAGLDGRPLAAACSLLLDAAADAAVAARAGRQVEGWAGPGGAELRRAAIAAAEIARRLGVISTQLLCSEGVSCSCCILVAVSHAVSNVMGGGFPLPGAGPAGAARGRLGPAARQSAAQHPRGSFSASVACVRWLMLESLHYLIHQAYSRGRPIQIPHIREIGRPCTLAFLMALLRGPCEFNKRTHACVLALL